MKTFITLVLLILSVNSFGSSIHYDIDRKMHVLTGKIVKEDVDDMIEYFEHVKGDRELKGSYLRLDSEGGSLYASFEMAKIIRNYGINTFVDTRCSSACTTLFLGGVNRIVTKTAEMRYHYAYIADESDYKEKGVNTLLMYGQALTFDLMAHYFKYVESEDPAYLTQYLKEVFRATTPESLQTANNYKLVRTGIVTFVYEGAE